MRRLVRFVRLVLMIGAVLVLGMETAFLVVQLDPHAVGGSGHLEDVGEGLAQISTQSLDLRHRHARPRRRLPGGGYWSR